VLFGLEVMENMAEALVAGVDAVGAKGAAEGVAGQAGAGGQSGGGVAGGGEQLGVIRLFGRPVCGGGWG
jgi:hypothetical protein